jgi:cytochrome P450
MPINVNDLEMPFLNSRVEIKNEDYSREDFFNMARGVAEESWIARSAVGYNVFHHDDVSAVMRDRRWHSALGLLADLNPFTTPDFKRRRKTSIIAIDGEEHNRLKRLLTPRFTPSIADDLRPFMRQIVNRLIDDFIDNGKADIAVDISRQYPVQIICHLFGIPEYDLDKFSKWSVDMLRNFDMDYTKSTDAILQSQKEMDEYVEGLIALRRSNPQDDLISMLVQTDDNGDVLSNEEIITLIEALMIAGIDTTQNQLSTAVSILIDNPSAWSLLSEDPSNAKFIVEELMRMNGSVSNTGRIAAEDIEYKGVLFPKGTIMFVNLAIANYDSSTFSNPDKFVHNRRELESTHMSFGAGLHYCLGAPIARAELQEALVVIANRLKNIQRNGETIYKDENSAVYGPVSLPVTFSKY